MKNGLLANDANYTGNFTILYLLEKNYCKNEQQVVQLIYITDIINLLTPFVLCLF